MQQNPLQNVSEKYLNVNKKCNARLHSALIASIHIVILTEHRVTHNCYAYDTYKTVQYLLSVKHKMQ